MKTKKLLKRLSASLLVMLMFVSIMPLNLMAATETNEKSLSGQNYVSLPITVRDFAADGMLFEFNDRGGTKITGTDGKTYIDKNNLGFGLLASNGNSADNILAEKDNAIEGTQYVSNGTWNSSSQPAVKKVSLNSGAVQEMYGALVRTNLVTGELDENKKPVYTESTVTFLANLLEKTLPDSFENSDGTRNLSYVMGYKHVELGNKDLATVLREKINGKGNYQAAREKFLNGNLDQVENISTYFDAAYFLLHNVFTDKTGYGKTISQYKELQLVEKVIDGKTVYVFNSAYDNSVYDSEAGIIYNQQTDTITARKSDNKVVYVRGNVQPENRFDPIGDLGYGKNGNSYLKVNNHTDITNYYNKTNYNQTLEGHAQFIYYYDEELYFTFTGDDDVYLYINGVRVLDIGGAHAIAKVRINMNDIAELCNLKDGQAYDFDFYYMERHGTAANFGIETNIKIVDPRMATTKKGYQNGGEVGYGGYIDDQKAVTYEFGLQNNGETEIHNLTFQDETIGVLLSKNSVILNAESDIENLVFTKYKADGTVETTYKGIKEVQTIQDILAAGLGVGEKLTVYGLSYTIPADEDKWENNEFINTVNTTAVSIDAANSSSQYLNGMAQYKVQKRDYTYDTLHYYDWGTLDKEATVHGMLKGSSKSVKATKADLVAVVDKNPDISLSAKATIELCSPTGGSTGNINTKAKVNSDGSITYTGDRTGADSYFYLVKDGNAKYGPVRVDIYTYGVADNIYILDYNLPVELNDGEASFLTNDVVSLDVLNPYKTGYEIEEISDATSNYGNFSFNNPSLKYTMKKIMNDEDSVMVTITVKETKATEVTEKTGVEMTQKITTAPASVVYYEDTFTGEGAINYTDATVVGGDGNKWVLYESVDSNGNLQSADQESNYGSDPNYEADKQGELVLKNENNLTDAEKEKVNEIIETIGGTLEGDASNGTIHATVVGEGNSTTRNMEILNFDFYGTGFEIVSRTTADNYAVLSVKVTKITTDTTTGTKTEELVSQFPVITECVSGDIYQVPIIAVKDMNPGNYHVSLTAARSTDTATRVVYIDGIRIYGALEGKTIEVATTEGGTTEVSKKDEYYSDDEKAAEYFEIKKLIVGEEEKSGKVVYADIITDEEGENPVFGCGGTMIEDTEDGGFILTTSYDLSKYIEFGPNNELYLDGSGSIAVIAFSLIPDANVTEEERTIQIGAHRKTDAQELDFGSVALIYGSTAEQINDYDNVPSYMLESGTEQYYTIDPANLTMEDGKYNVLIGANGMGDNIYTTIALTNLKISGYTLAPAEIEILDDYYEDELESYSLWREVMTLRMFNAESGELVNEELEILSAKFKTDKVVSGKTATLTVKTTNEAEKVVVLDEDGNEVEFTKSSKKVEKAKKGKGEDTFTFTLVWKVKGKKGQELNYNVKAYDINGAASINEETVSITIR